MQSQASVLWHKKITALGNKVFSNIHEYLSRTTTIKTCLEGDGKELEDDPLQAIYAGALTIASAAAVDEATQLAGYSDSDVATKYKQAYYLLDHLNSLSSPELPASDKTIVESFLKTIQERIRATSTQTP